MKIKNLAQLKRAIQSGCTFEIVRHYVKPEYEGQIRKPHVIQTNGFYSVVYNDPGHPVSKANGGRGSWLEYGKASAWTFEDELCKLFSQGKDRPVWEIRFLD